MMIGIPEDNSAGWAAIFTAECGYFSAARLQRFCLWPSQRFNKTTGIRMLAPTIESLLLTALAPGSAVLPSKAENSYWSDRRDFFNSI